MKRIILIVLLLPAAALAWKNGQDGNARTDTPAECGNPAYSTHDWIADQALALLPDNEKAWILPHRNTYLIGTEAPDNKTIPAICNTTHRGYDDRSKGHSVEWKADFSGFVASDSQPTGLKDRAARRAQEEYNKAVIAFYSGDRAAAAFFLGAMAHYIGDVSQYGHSVPFETSANHSGYEGWVGRRTDTTDDDFVSFIDLDSLVRRTPYTGVKRISKATAQGQGNILSASAMINKFDNDRDEDFTSSVGTSLNMAANTLADVLHTFFLNVVSED